MEPVHASSNDIRNRQTNARGVLSTRAGTAAGGGTEDLLPAPAGPETRSPNTPAALWNELQPPRAHPALGSQQAAAMDQIQTALVVIRVRLAETDNSVCSRARSLPRFW